MFRDQRDFRAIAFQAATLKPPARFSLFYRSRRRLIQNSLRLPPRPLNLFTAFTIHPLHSFRGSC